MGNDQRKKDLTEEPVPELGDQDILEAMKTIPGYLDITPGDFKEITGVTRKYAIPLLEYFDALQVTMRVEDKRLLRESKESS